MKFRVVGGSREDSTGASQSTFYYEILFHRRHNRINKSIGGEGNFTKIHHTAENCSMSILCVVSCIDSAINHQLLTP